MTRPLIFLILTAFLLSSLSGCIVLDHHKHGKKPQGHSKKEKHDSH